MLLEQVTCPHCWEAFTPDRTLAVSEHVELLGDPRLGGEAQLRFLPSRFTVEGDPIDARGMACRTLACPRCHLKIPRTLLEVPPLFLSILGAPGTGKSYLLAAMTWGLRRDLPARFRLQFADADPASNRSLIEYEESLFLGPDGGEPIPIGNFIRKTELQGELYNTVQHGQQVISHVQPFLFHIAPAGDHPRAASTERRGGRMVCLYDNAGEHFQPGEDRVSVPVTRHLAKSKALIFVFDPTRDPRFARAMAERIPGNRGIPPARASRQEVIFQEAAMRIRRLKGLPPDRPQECPVIVALTKCDWWDSMIGLDPPGEPFRIHSSGMTALDIPLIETRSRRIRRLLAETCPELVAAVEGFSTKVDYVPVSALGRGVRDVPGRGPCLRPAEVRPYWAAVPMLLALSRDLPGLIPRIRMGTWEQAAEAHS